MVAPGPLPAPCRQGVENCTLTMNDAMVSRWLVASLQKRLGSCCMTVLPCMHGICVVCGVARAHTDCYTETRFDSGRHRPTSAATMTPHQHSKAAASEPCHVEVPAFHCTHSDQAQRSPRTARKLHKPQQAAACTRAMSQTVFTQMAKHSGGLLAAAAAAGDTPLRV